MLLFDSFVIVICLASLILCTRSIVLALRLRKVCMLEFSSPLLTSTLSLFKQWALVLGHPVLSGAFD